MLDAISLDRALCLPATDVAALLNGQLIAVTPQVSIQKGWIFALYPTQTNSHLPIERQYHPQILPLLKSAVSQSQTEIVNIEAWAKCEHCKLIHEVEQLEILSHLTIWKKDALKEAMEQKQHLFLALLRIYKLPEKIQVISPISSSEKLGKFVSFSALNDRLDKTVKVREIIPVLSDVVFDCRKRQLEELRPPLHPELQELQHTIASLAENHIAFQQFNQKLQLFLGWTDDSTVEELDPDFQWISTIAKVGNSSDGHTFEKLVRRGLLKLGFSGSHLAPDSTGGAGGMDFYCEEPYPIVGECKATKTETVSDGTPAQLLKIGMNHLGKDQYNRSIKLIVAAGDLNSYALRTATENQMNVIKPETLQDLVMLQASYRGSTNLIELKKCLQQTPFGIADEKVISYINKIRQDLKLRSHVVKALKNYLHVKKVEDVGVERFCGVYDASNPPRDLSERELHELLIELSSPLTGYLGRRKGSDWRTDRFYFLRDLKVE
jgi:hypothetical protein